MIRSDRVLVGLVMLGVALACAAPAGADVGREGDIDYLVMELVA